MPYKKFPEKMAALMRSKKLTTTKLGELLSVNQSGISQLSSGKRRPSAEQAFLLSRAFGVSVDYLLDDEMDKPSSLPGLSESDRLILEAVRGLKLSASEAVRAMHVQLSDSQRVLLEVFRHTGLSASAAIRLLYASAEKPASGDPIAVIDLNRRDH